MLVLLSKVDNWQRLAGPTADLIKVQLCKLKYFASQINFVGLVLLDLAVVPFNELYDLFVLSHELLLAQLEVALLEQLKLLRAQLQEVSFARGVHLGFQI